jgi:hypothetical protein
MPILSQKSTSRRPTGIASNDSGPLAQAAGPSGPFERVSFTPLLQVGGPIWVGAFGEVNKTVDNLVAMIAKLAAKTRHGKSISPAPMSSSHGVTAIIKSQFLHALRVQVMKTNACLKLERRLYYLVVSLQKKLILSPPTTNLVVVPGILALMPVLVDSAL